MLQIPVVAPSEKMSMKESSANFEAASLGPHQFVCNILRMNEINNEWMELSSDSVITISTGLIVVRDMTTRSLQIDLPASSVERTEFIDHVNLIKITTKTRDVPMGLSLKNLASLTMLKESMTTHGIKHSDIVRENSLEMPNLSHPQVQEYVLKLMFSDDFSDFVDDLQHLLEAFDNRINQTSV